MQDEKPEKRVSSIPYVIEVITWTCNWLDTRKGVIDHKQYLSLSVSMSQSISDPVTLGDVSTLLCLLDKALEVPVKLQHYVIKRHRS